jgi:hypothetical protein
MVAATSGSTTTTQENVPNWEVSGDWFDVCKCNIPCPCEFAQAPTYGDCDGILAYNIKKGNYGETPLHSLNVLALGSFKGNIWAGDGKTKLNMALFFDEKANEHQREALNMIFSGRPVVLCLRLQSLSEKFVESNMHLSSLRKLTICLTGAQRYQEKF